MSEDGSHSELPQLRRRWSWLPRISVGCGSYRTLTSDSVYFESEESTLNATTTDDV